MMLPELTCVCLQTITTRHAEVLAPGPIDISARVMAQWGQGNGPMGASFSRGRSHKPIGR